jgi:hypothetical protein
LYNENNENKGSQMGHTKKIFKKNKTREYPMAYTVAPLNGITVNGIKATQIAEVPNVSQ